MTEVPPARGLGLLVNEFCRELLACARELGFSSHRISRSLCA